MIYVSYEELYLVRDQLLQLDNTYKSQIDELENLEAALSSMWQGAAQKAFHFAFQQDMLFFRGFYDLIQSYAEILGVFAENYKKADRYKVGPISFDFGDITSRFKKGMDSLHNMFNEIQEEINTMKSTLDDWNNKIKNFNPIEDIKDSDLLKKMFQGIDDLRLKGTETLEEVENAVKDYFDDVFEDGLFPDGIWHIPSKEDHYGRNEHNVIPENLSEVYTTNKNGEIVPQDGWKLLSPEQSKYHMQESPYQPKGEEQYNKKFINDDGSEVIICVPPPETGKEPYVVDDPVNGGTYNYSNPDWSDPSSLVGHFFNDMIPYYLWGNTQVDGGWLT